MNKLPLLGGLAALALTLTGCDSVTVVERHHDHRPAGYYGGNSYYSNSGYYARPRATYYDDRSYYRRSTPYYGSNSVVVNRKYENNGRDVYTRTTATRSPYGGVSRSTAVVVVDKDKKKKKHHHD